MSPQRSNDISDEIYHRIYRLIKRRLSAHTIAATLNLPVRTVLGVINRLERSEAVQEASDAASEGQQNGLPDIEQPSGSNEYLDIYFYPKTRYAILDLVGALSDEYTDQLHTELEKAVASSWKAIAIRMCDVYILAETAANELLSASGKAKSLGRYLALLDPSQKIEPSLTKFNLEASIPVFGTERAFEEAAFTKKGKMFGRRSTQNSS